MNTTNTPSGDARDQVERLRRDGGTYRAIAAAAGLAPSTVHGLASGRSQPTPHTTRALREVRSDILRYARVDAGGSRLRLRALHVMGHGSARIGRALGVREVTIRRIVTGDATTVSTALRDAITGLYDTWWDKRAPERTRFERAAATAARRRAATGNWCAGAGLDDDKLDTPGYRPRSKWRPAAGTGTARDVTPPPRPRHHGHTRQSGR
jgi:plasmid maintenance system antidote protein VapI